MKILDRYTIKGFMLPFFYCLIVFYLLYMVADILGHLNDILKNKMPFQILAQFYLSFLPLIYVQTAPIAILLGIVYLLSTMNKNNELTAMKASGINIVFTLRPVFITGIIICLSIFYINENLVPKTSLIAHKIKMDYLEVEKKDKEVKAVKDLTVYGKAKQMIYAKRFDTSTNKLYDIIILEYDEKQNLTRKIISKEAMWLVGRWRFYDVIIYRFSKQGQPVGKVLNFKEKIIRLPEKPAELLKGEFMSSFMNYPQLKSYINRLKGTDKKTLNRLKTDLYFKLALPFVAFVMILLGIPFAIASIHGGVTQSVGISIIAGLGYYACIGISLALGKGSFLPPLVAAHFPNVAFFIIALVLIRRAPA